MGGAHLTSLCISFGGSGMRSYPNPRANTQTIFFAQQVSGGVWAVSWRPLAVHIWSLVIFSLEEPAREHTLISGHFQTDRADIALLHVPLIVAPTNKTELRQETFIATFLYRIYVCFFRSSNYTTRVSGLFFPKCFHPKIQLVGSPPSTRIVLADQLAGEHRRCTSNFTRYFIVRSGMRSYTNPLANPEAFFLRATSFWWISSSILAATDGAHLKAPCIFFGGSGTRA
jgi:hypothetical protein